MPSYRCTRRALSVALVGGIACASLLGLTHTAAATVSAASCGGSIAGKVGEAVTLKSETVREYVVQSVHDGPEAPLLGLKNEQTRMREAFEEGKFDPIRLPKVPDSASSRFTGERIAAAVLAKIDSVDDVSDIARNDENRENITSAIGKNCGLRVTATNYTAPTSIQPRIGSGQRNNDQQSNDQGLPTTTPQQPGAAAPPPSARYGTGEARAPLQYYTPVPVASHRKGRPAAERHEHHRAARAAGGRPVRRQRGQRGQRRGDRGGTEGGRGAVAAARRRRRTGVRRGGPRADLGVAQGSMTR
ncbi:MAG: hypothetical protein GEV04_21220 [Actinophytocola sp.]|nr:hypothetical protein [Actinophytocola sp.]